MEINSLSPAHLPGKGWNGEQRSKWGSRPHCIPGEGREGGRQACTRVPCCVKNVEEATRHTEAGVAESTLDS